MLSKFRFSMMSPANLFLILGLLLGMSYTIAIPFAAGFDEETHLVRIYELTRLRLFPNQSSSKNGVVAPVEFFSLSYQRRYLQTPAFDLFQPAVFLKKIDPSAMVFTVTRSTYPPVSFLPQAGAALIGWRVLHLPVIPVAIASRMAGLLMYLLGVYVAIRLLPFGKWLMLILGLAPMALFQAATLNIDGYTIASVFLFSAVTLKFSMQPRGSLTARHAAALMALIFAVALARPGTFFVLVLLILLRPRQFQQRAWWAAAWVGVLLATALAMAWNSVSTPASLFGGAQARGMLPQALFILSHPLDFATVLFSGIAANLGRYATEWVGVYGHWLGVVPAAVYFLFPLALVAGVLSEPKNPSFSMRRRLVIAAIFWLSSGATALMMYFIYFQGIGVLVAGVQGRYFLPVGFLLFLPLCGLIRLPEGTYRIARFTSLGLWAVAIGLYSFGLAATYYSNCWQSYYTNASCTQPVYKNLDKKNAPEIEITQSLSLIQTFTSVCGPIDSVEVWVKQAPVRSESSFFFTLLDEEGNRLAESELLSSQVRTPAYLKLPVASPQSDNTHSYQIHLRSGQNFAQPGILVATTPYHQYTGGNLSLDGQPQNSDLIFHYSCPSPWQQALIHAP